MNKILKIRVAFVLLGIILFISLYINIELKNKVRVFDQIVDQEIYEIIEAHKEIDYVLESSNSNTIDKYSVFLVAEKNRIVLNKIISLNEYYSELNKENSDYGKIASIYQEFDEFLSFDLLHRDISIAQKGYNIEYIDLDEINKAKISFIKSINSNILYILEESNYIRKNSEDISFEINNFNLLLNEIGEHVEKKLREQYSSDLKWSSSNSIFDSLIE